MQVSYRDSAAVGGSTKELEEPHPALSVRTSNKERRKHSSSKNNYSRCDSFDEVLENLPEKSLPNYRVKTGKNPIQSREAVRSRACSVEEGSERKHPELCRVQTVPMQSEQSGTNYHKPCSRKTSSDNFVLTHLDPQVDNRAALKPSLLKKKKTLGILFSFNTMLSKKREKIQKETAKYKSEQEKSQH